MKRILLGLLLGAMVFGVAFAGAKVATVTNPMSADLNANGFDIMGASTVNAINFEADGYLRGHNLIAVNGAGQNRASVSSCDNDYGCVFLQAGDGSGPGVRAGSADPTVAPCPAMAAGSLYLRHVDADNGEVWAHVGSDACAWIRVTL